MKITEENIVEYVLRNGKEYVSALLPNDLKRMPLHQCFDNCAVTALTSKYRYVEGIAQNPHTRKFMAHAWLTDGVHAFDVTWGAFNEKNEEIPFPGKYFGIEMPIQEVANFMITTGYVGVLMNSFRDLELAGKIIPL